MTLHSTDDLKLVDGDIGYRGNGQTCRAYRNSEFWNCQFAGKQRGRLYSEALIEYTAKDFRRVTQTSLTGFFYVSQLAVAQMRLQKFRHVVNISTSLGSQPIAGAIRDGEHIVGAHSTLHCLIFPPPGRLCFAG
jgi:hypothetical protein